MKSILHKTQTALQNFANLAFPNNCASCNNALLQNETIICTQCLVELPKTSFHNEPENAMHKIFWGRVPIQHATAYSYFLKKGRLQRLIHKLKYEGEKEVGYELGKHLGAVLKNSPEFMAIDAIVPVPIHPRRRQERGYNQSEWIGYGLSEVIDKPLETNAIHRRLYTNTQTKKSRFDRWKNVSSKFALTRPESIENKHLLLIDDVITTGATLEACTETLLQANETKVSIAVIGFASG